MKLRFQKCMRIANDLLYFCYHAGADGYEFKLFPEKDLMRFVIKASIPDMKEDMIDTLNSALKLPRAHEVEQNYWELGGDIDTPSELTLVGMMLDESSAVYEGGILTITAERLG